MKIAQAVPAGKQCHMLQVYTDVMEENSFLNVIC